MTCSNLLVHVRRHKLGSNYHHDLPVFVQYDTPVVHVYNIIIMSIWSMLTVMCSITFEMSRVNESRPNQCRPTVALYTVELEICGEKLKLRGTLLKALQRDDYGDLWLEHHTILIEDD
jgi:hypothetical protein